MRPRTRKVILTVAAAVVLIPLALLAVVYVWSRHHWPYGVSHCCDKILFGALRQYAETHGGAFPAGEATPEASLSLLYRETTGEGRLADANLLRGKTVPETAVKEILERGELLTPDTCGWHYVEGLRLDDDPRLALFWDKVGLDHNGGRLPKGDHVVMPIGGFSKYIAEADWAEFIEEQDRLLAERKTAIRYDAKVQIDSQEVTVQVRVVGDGVYGSEWNGGSSSRRLIATTKKQEVGVQGLPVIPQDEIKNAKVVIEQEKPRVRFVLQGREIVYDRLGFHIEAASSDPTNE